MLLDCLRGEGGVHQLTFDTITDGHVDSPGARCVRELPVREHVRVCSFVCGVSVGAVFANPVFANGVRSCSFACIFSEQTTLNNEELPEQCIKDALHTYEYATFGCLRSA